MPISNSRKRQRGSALVETGFIFTTFAFMLIGAFDFGQFLFVHQALAERARSATRWGVVNDPTDLNAIRCMVLYNQTTAPGVNGSDDTHPGYFGMTPSMVQVSNPGTGTDDNRLVVSIINYPYTVLSPYIGGTYRGPNITVSYPIGR